MPSTKLHPHIVLTLRVLARKLERDLLRKDEKDDLANILRQLAAGRSLPEVFGLSVRTEKSGAAKRRIFDVELLRSPRKLGGEGMKKIEAMEIIAAAEGVKVESIEADYKTPAGREAVEHFHRVVYDPLDLDEEESPPAQRRDAHGS